MKAIKYSNEDIIREKRYFLGVLSNINYMIAIHPSDAKKRLSSQAIHLFRIPKEIVPENFRKEYEQLLNLISLEHKTNPQGMGITFHGKKNQTIANYIKLLLDIQIDLEIELEIEEKKYSKTNL